MNTMFMNSENSKTSDPHRLFINLTDKINLKRSNKYVALSNRSIYYTWKNIKTSYKNSKLNISAPTWDKELELPDGSYSISDIKDYFLYVYIYISVCGVSVATDEGLSPKLAPNEGGSRGNIES